jgi:glycosyltransferase involved in cell wall biosynthesis
MVAPTSFFADYGCHVRILEEVRALQNRGHAVRVVTYHNGDNLPGIDIQRTVGLPWRTRLMVGSSRHKIYLDAMLFFAVFRHTRSFRPDIIHAHLHEGALIGSVVGRLLRKPVVFDYQGSLTEEMLDHNFIRPGGLRERVVRRLERLIDRLASIIVPSGTAARDHLLSRGVPEDRVRLLSDAVDTTRFDPDKHRCSRQQVRASLGIPGNARVVVYLGLLAEYQGTSLLIDAARLLLDSHQDMYFIIAGYPGVDHYVEYASTSPHANRILFPGRVAYRDAPALLAAGDVAVAPKQSTTEGNGKIYNYMSMGLPTVAIDTPSNRLVLADLGHFIQPANPGLFASAIEQSFQDTTDHRTMLRERVTGRFSWSERVHELERIYAEIMGTDTEIAITPSSSCRCNQESQVPPNAVPDCSPDQEPAIVAQDHASPGT